MSNTFNFKMFPYFPLYSACCNSEAPLESSWFIWNETHISIYIFIWNEYISVHEIYRDNWNTGITVRDFTGSRHWCILSFLASKKENILIACMRINKFFSCSNSLVKGWSVKMPRGRCLKSRPVFFLVRRYLTVNLILGIWTPPNLPLDLGTSLNTSLKQNLQLDQSPSTLAFLPPKADFCLFFFMNFGWLGDSCS